MQNINLLRNPSTSSNINESLSKNELDEIEKNILNNLEDISSMTSGKAEYHPSYFWVERGFITRDGGIIDTFKDRHYDLEVGIQNWLPSLNLPVETIDELFKHSIVHVVTDALGWIRINGYNEDYICLPSSRPSDAQLNTLEHWIDDFFTADDSISVMSYNGDSYATFSKGVSGEGDTGKSIVKQIKRYYVNGVLTEEFIDDNRNLFATTNVYEAKNILSRNDKAYRIVYDKKQKLYLIGDANEYIHMEMIETAIEQGYFAGMKRWQIPGYMDEAPFEEKAIIAIYTPNKLVPETMGADLGEDGYNDLYVYDNFVVTTRDSNWSICPLSKTLGVIKAHKTLTWDTDEYGNHIEKIIDLNESLLTEKTRQELINKSKAGKNYKTKGRENQNRWERRKYSSVANSVRDYNNINMDVFFKDDILEFVVKIQGETNNYEVTITFSNILRRLQQEVKSNNNKLEFKCVLRALIDAFNSDDVYVSCSCPDWQFSGFNYYGVKQQYNSKPIMGKAMQAPRIKNPLDDKGACCKHINLVLSNTDWMMKIASVINNYIKWCKNNMGRNYADIIFPVVYGMPYNKAIQLSLFDDPEDNGLLPTDQKTISAIINKELGNRDERGQWGKNNEYRFKKPDTKKTSAPEDNPGQMKLKFDTVKKQIINPEEEEEE